jgi:hypothetical protein
MIKPAAVETFTIQVSNALHLRHLSLYRITNCILVDFMRHELRRDPRRWYQIVKPHPRKHDCVGISHLRPDLFMVLCYSPTASTPSSTPVKLPSFSMSSDIVRSPCRLRNVFRSGPIICHLRPSTKASSESPTGHFATFQKPSAQLKRHHCPAYTTAALLVLAQMRRMDHNQSEEKHIQPQGMYDTCSPS